MMFWSLFTTFVSLSIAETTASFGETTFTMGSGKRPMNLPAHLVTLSPYKIDLTEVSIQAFEQFVEKDGVTTNIGVAKGLAWRTENPDGAGATHQTCWTRR